MEVSCWVVKWKFENECQIFFVKTFFRYYCQTLHICNLIIMLFVHVPWSVFDLLQSPFPMLDNRFVIHFQTCTALLLILGLKLKFLSAFSKVWSYPIIPVCWITDKWHFFSYLAMVSSNLVFDIYFQTLQLCQDPRYWDIAIAILIIMLFLHALCALPFAQTFPPSYTIYMV